MSPRWAGLLLTGIALVGCDRADDGASSGSVNPRPATISSDHAAGRGRTATTVSTTSPATTRAAVESLINIDGNLVLFPAAKMRLDASDGKTVARLFSDDPKGAALDENYDGNSFYLQIELDELDGVDATAHGDGGAAKLLDGVQLTYRAPSSERDDSPYGIFLEGRRWVLQPADVRVAFEGTNSPLSVTISGTFLMFDTNDDTAKPKRAQVVAQLRAAVQAGK